MPICLLLILDYVGWKNCFSVLFKNADYSEITVVRFEL